MKTCLLWMLVCAFFISGCSTEQSERSQQSGPQESFRKIVSEVKARAAKRTTDVLTLTVTDQIVDDIPNEPVTGIIHVKKQKSASDPGNATKMVEIFDVYFVYEAGNWRCKSATSKELEGDSVVAQNSLDGPDIRFANLLIWIGL